MRVLHICNDFAGSKVHKKLYEELDSLGVEQTVFTYVKDSKKVNVNRFRGENTRFCYSVSLKSCHRLLYGRKVRDVFSALESSVNLEEYDVVHATTLFSDGAIANLVHRKYGIPYICAVRSTDVFVFLKWAPHTWRRGRRIAQEASRLVFITENIKSRFESYYSTRRWKPVESGKKLIQPNGVDAFWLDNKFEEIHTVDNSLLFVGELIRRKHALQLCQAVLELAPVIPGIHLTIVGGPGQEGKKITEIADGHPDVIRYLGLIKDKNQLLELYRTHSVFVLPSERETFGLVYVEALTQSLPIIYSEKDGVDGLFPDEVGVGIDPRSVESIKTGIRSLLDHYPSLPVATLIGYDRFDWGRIAKRYFSYYEEMIGENKV